MTPVPVVAIQVVRRAVDEADLEIEVAVAVVVAPRGGARFHLGGEADCRRDVLEPWS